MVKKAGRLARKLKLRDNMTEKERRDLMKAYQLLGQGIEAEPLPPPEADPAEIKDDEDFF